MYCEVIQGVTFLFGLCQVSLGCHHLSLCEKSKTTKASLQQQLLRCMSEKLCLSKMLSSLVPNVTTIFHLVLDAHELNL